MVVASNHADRNFWSNCCSTIPASPLAWYALVPSLTDVELKTVLLSGAVFEWHWIEGCTSFWCLIWMMFNGRLCFLLVSPLNDVKLKAIFPYGASNWRLYIIFLLSCLFIFPCSKYSVTKWLLLLTMQIEISEATVVLPSQSFHLHGMLWCLLWMTLNWRLLPATVTHVVWHAVCFASKYVSHFHKYHHSWECLSDVGLFEFIMSVFFLLQLAP